jgi:hypothetical protein
LEFWGISDDRVKRLNRTVIRDEVVVQLAVKQGADTPLCRYPVEETMMLDEATLEHRLITLEQTVSELQRKVDSRAVSESWLQKLTGSMSDEAAFLEALEYGRAFRQSDKPMDERDEPV